MTFRILLSKVVGKQTTETDGSNSIFNVAGKRKTKTNLEFRFPMTWVNEKRNWKFEFPFSYFAGKRLALRYTHCERVVASNENPGRRFMRT